ncbi:CCR4-NOT regulatory complex component [Pleurotus pulmonarius]|nr:CCR4-NOT regulatory complex component [Pleurotus pulmonarius]
MEATEAVSVTNLTYSYHPGSPPSLLDINLNLPKGSRTLIVGANGAGKSTLLQILAGKRLVSIDGADIRIKGRDVFRDSPPGVTYLGTEWAMNPVVRGDIVVSHFLDSVGGYRHKERRDRLLDILDIDLDWHMHAISDGERRRVQLCFGLMIDWDVLLLDEVTVDLDVLVRDELLQFLKSDSEERGATILYATHIFDGLGGFPTHIAHMRFGSFVTPPTPWPIADTPTRPGTSSALYSVALEWIREDREHRRQLEKEGMKKRGARREQAVPSNSEIFYRNPSSGPPILATDAPAPDIKRPTPKTPKRSAKQQNGDGRTHSTPKAPKSMRRDTEISQKTESKIESDPLFFIDVTPIVLQPALKPTESTTAKNSGEGSQSQLLLPSHVGLDGSQFDPPNAEGEDAEETFIEYLDYDDNRKVGLVRYFEEPEEEDAQPVKPVKRVCRNCGGNHNASGCKVIIDCDLRGPEENEEPSAFSEYNTSSGPFFDANAEPTSGPSRSRPLRDWERPDYVDPKLPGNVGKEGRKKDRAKLEKRAREIDDEDEEDNWFNRGARKRSGGSRSKPKSADGEKRGGNGNGNARPKGKMPQISFKNGARDLDSRAGTNGAPVSLSLLDRIQMGDEDKAKATSFSRSGFNNDERGQSSRNRDRDRGRDDRDRDDRGYRHRRESDSYQGSKGGGPRSRDKSRDDRQPPTGPRYKGGYSR